MASHSSRTHCHHYRSSRNASQCKFTVSIIMTFLIWFTLIHLLGYVIIANVINTLLILSKIVWWLRDRFLINWLCSLSFPWCCWHHYSIDDIEDNSVLRRGIPTAHNIFGIPSTLNTGNYVYFLALDKLINNFPAEKVAEAVNIYSQQMIELHRGQGLDIYWRDNFACPSESEYIAMIKKKTGGLFNMGIRLLQLFSDNSADFSLLVELLGTFFQIRDDYANLLSQEVCTRQVCIYFCTNKSHFLLTLLTNSMRVTRVTVKTWRKESSPFQSFILSETILKM